MAKAGLTVRGVMMGMLEEDARDNSACGTSSSNLSFSLPFASFNERIGFFLIFFLIFFSHIKEGVIYREQRTCGEESRYQIPVFDTYYEYLS